MADPQLETTLEDRTNDQRTLESRREEAARRLQDPHAMRRVEPLSRREVEKRIDELASLEHGARGHDSLTERARARERREIASLLHDSIGQLLPLANHKLAALRDRSDGMTRAKIVEIQQLIIEAHTASTSLTASLSPPTIHEMGLAAALKILAQEMLDRHELKVDLEIEGDVTGLSEAMEHALYRVVRELLVNAAKHSGNTQARVRTKSCGSQLQITVEDSGVGFDPVASDSNGLGLRGARDRLDDLGARIEIDSRPGAGTRVVLHAFLEAAPPAESGGAS